MFSTSPSIFSLEHPLYDVSLKNCYSLEAESDAETKETSKAKNAQKSP
jgi:hypothetical protein